MSLRHTLFRCWKTQCHYVYTVDTWKCSQLNLAHGLIIDDEGVDT